MISKSRLIIYIHNDFNFKHVDINSEMSDNDETKPSWESLFIEIKHKSTNSKTHIIRNIYRRPIDIVSSCNNFSAAFSETLTLLQKKKRSIYIAGDLNFDLLKINTISIIVPSLRTLYLQDFIQKLVFQLDIIGTLVLPLSSITYLETILI